MYIVFLSGILFRSFPEYLRNVIRARCSVFFFKQKTAYEILRSDWSSDVCSSDPGGRRIIRSEEHTSELQSHSEISYAVSLIKKKTHQNLSQIKKLNISFDSSI